MDNQIIKLTKEHRGGAKSTTFTGRPEGREVRNALCLDDKDCDANEYSITIPDDTTSFNVSFYLGLFFPSIEKLGWEKFTAKYRMDLSGIQNEELREVLQQNIENCRRKAINELNYSLG